MNRIIRKAHRWLAIAFTLAVLLNVAAKFMSLQSGPAFAIVAVVALMSLLIVSGLYLFAHPYFSGGSGKKGD